MLNRSKFAVFAAILLLLGSLSARPMAHVGISGGDQGAVLQPGTLFLALSRPMDVAKAVPTKAKRDVHPDHPGDPVLPTPQQQTEPVAPWVAPKQHVVATAPDAPELAAWPRGPPAA